KSDWSSDVCSFPGRRYDREVSAFQFEAAAFIARGRRMSLHIVIDVRRIHDFGIGTYIRSLVQALGEVDLRNHYTLIISPSELRELPALPANFEVATYSRRDDAAADHIAFPAFLRQIPA